MSSDKEKVDEYVEVYGKLELQTICSAMHELLSQGVDFYELLLKEKKICEQALKEVEVVEGI